MTKIILSLCAIASCIIGAYTVIAVGDNVVGLLWLCLAGIANLNAK